MFFSAEKRPANTSRRVSSRQPELGAQIARRPVGREGLHVDAERLQRGVHDADAVQVFAHVAARRQHLLAAFVGEPHVPLDELLHGAAEPASGELGKVRVIETDQRNAAATGDAGGRPDRMKCIADLDEVRFERVDGPRPAQRIQRQTVVERAGNQPALDRGNVAGRVRVVSRRARPGCVASWYARASTRVWRAGSASLHRWSVNRTRWHRRRACLVLLCVFQCASIGALQYCDQSAQTRFPMSNNHLQD